LVIEVVCGAAEIQNEHQSEQEFVQHDLYKLVWVWLICVC
jgi:membrane-associated PAP2 superfamily phosphatase